MSFLWNVTELALVVTAHFLALASVDAARHGITADAIVSFRLDTISTTKAAAILSMG